VHFLDWHNYTPQLEEKYMNCLICKTESPKGWKWCPRCGYKAERWAAPCAPGMTGAYLRWLLLNGRGRLHRAPFWAAILALNLAGALCALIPGYGMHLLRVLNILLIVVIVKRCQDRGMSGGLLLAFLVPLVFVRTYASDMLSDMPVGFYDYSSPGFIALYCASLALMLWFAIDIGFLRGTPGDNRYGRDPLAPQGKPDAAGQDLPAPARGMNYYLRWAIAIVAAAVLIAGLFHYFGRVRDESVDCIGLDGEDGWTPEGINIEPPVMVPIPAGMFKMGGRRAVTLARGLYMGKHEVTQELWQAVMGGNPSYFANSPVVDEALAKRPVEQVSWYETLVFCNKLSAMEGLTPVYSVRGSINPANWGSVPYSRDSAWDAAIMNTNANGYRLPTEAEWEYACRAGTDTKYNLGDTWSDDWG
jgi:uncharacterized membrane protein YhaH (DUF805 family)